MKDKFTFWPIGALILGAAVLLFQGEIYGLTPEEVIKLKQAGVSDEIIQKMLESEKTNSTGTVVFGTIGGPHGKWAEYFKTYVRGTERVCKLDGIDFPTGYSGNGYTGVFPYGSRHKDGNYYRLNFDFFMVEVEAGRHDFIFPDKEGKYGAAHHGGAEQSTSIYSSSSQNCTFLLKPAEIVFFQYKDKIIKRCNSIEEIIRDPSPADLQIEQLLGLKKSIGYYLPSKILKDHEARYKGHQFPKAETSMVVLRAEFDSGESEGYRRRPGEARFYPQGSNELAGYCRVWPNRWRGLSDTGTWLKHGKYYMKLDEKEWSRMARSKYGRFFEEWKGMLYFQVTPGTVTVIEMRQFDFPQVFYEDWSYSPSKLPATLWIHIITYADKIRQSDSYWGPSISIVDAGRKEYHTHCSASPSAIKKGQSIVKNSRKFEKVAPGNATVRMRLSTQTKSKASKNRGFDTYWNGEQIVDIRPGGTTELTFIARDDIVEMSVVYK